MRLLYVSNNKYVFQKKKENKSNIEVYLHIIREDRSRTSRFRDRTAESKVTDFDMTVSVQK